MSVTNMLAALTLGSAPVPSAPLLLPNVLESVRQHLPQVLAAHEDAAAARAELVGAQGGFDPVLRARGSATPLGAYPSQTLDTWVEQPTPVLGSSLYAGWRMGQGAFAPYDEKLATGNLGEVRAGIRVPLGRHLLLDPRRAALQTAGLNTALQDASVDLALLAGGATAANSWLSWVAAGRRLAVQERLLTLAQTRQQALEARASKGDLAWIEVDENRRAILKRQSQVIKAQRSLDQAALRLSLYSRTNVGAPMVPTMDQLPAELPEARPLPSVADSVALARHHRPEFAQQEYLERQVKVSLRLAQQDLLPKVDLWLQTSQDVDTQPGKYRPELAGVVSVEVPFPNRAARGGVEAKEAAARKVRHQTRWLEDRVAAEIRDVLNAWHAARDRELLAAQEMAVALRLAQAELRRFDAGVGTLLLVNLREQASAVATLALVDARVEVARAELAWKAATARLYP